MATNTNFKVKNGLDVAGTATATTFVGALTGNASTATTLANGHTISITGDGTGTSGSFNGSADASLALTLASVGTAGTYKSVTTDAKGRVTAGTNPTTLAGYGITDGFATSGGNVTGHILPATDNTYDLGSPTKMWRDVYISNASLYVNNKQVISDDSGTIVVSTSTNQNLRFETTGSGNLELLTSTGNALINTSIVLQTGKQIRDSAGIEVEFGDDIKMGGNKIVGLAAPSAGTDAANKTYVDSATSADTTIVRTTGTQSIGGAKTFTGDMIISGNLTISGSTTTVNTETVAVADNIIQLNSNFTTGTPSEDSGFQVQRGDEAAVKFVWDEANDRFTMKDAAGTPNYLSLYTTATITAGTFVGALTGNASTATALATGRTINGASFNGTSNISFTTDAVDEGSTNLYYTNGRASAAAPVQSVFGRTGAVSLLSGDVTTALGFTPQTLDADLTAIGALTGTSGFLKKTAADTWALDTSTYLTANQAITLTGDVTGSGNGSFATTLASVGTAGTYRSVTTDAKGRVTAGTNPTTLAGYGITDAFSGAASGLTGTTLPSNIVGSFLTSVGSLSSLVVLSSGTANALIKSTSVNTTHYADLEIVGGNDTSGHVTVYGSSHATHPNQVWVNTGNPGSLVLATGDTERVHISATGIDVATDLNVTGAVALADDFSVLGASSFGTIVATGTVAGSNINNSGDIIGNSATTTKLLNARTINGTSFDGSGNITVTAAAGTLTGATLASGVTASSLTSVGTLSSLQVTSASEGLRISSSVARGSGSNYLSFYDPTGVKGFVGYTGSDDTFIVRNSLNAALLFSTNSVERLRIDATGNVGIGVTPSAWSGFTALQLPNGSLFGDTSSGVRLIHNGYYDGSQWRYTATGYSSRLELKAGGAIFYTAASGTAGAIPSWTTAVTLDSSGNLCIGVAASSQTPANGICTTSIATASQLSIGHASGTSTGSGYQIFAYNGGAIGSITQSGTTAVLYNTTSDARLKENINPSAPATEVIQAMQVRSFDFKEVPDSHVDYGFIAQELNEVAPVAVSVGDDGSEITQAWGVDYSKLVPILVKSLQEALHRVEALEAKVAELK